MAWKTIAEISVPQGARCDGCVRRLSNGKIYNDKCLYRDEEGKVIVDPRYGIPEDHQSDRACKTCGIIKDESEFPKCESCGGAGWFENAPDEKGGTYTGHCEDCHGSGLDTSSMDEVGPNLDYHRPFGDSRNVDERCDHNGLKDAQGNIQCSQCKDIYRLLRTRTDRGGRLVRPGDRYNDNAVLEKYHAMYHPHPITGQRATVGLVNDIDDEATQRDLKEMEFSV